MTSLADKLHSSVERVSRRHLRRPEAEPLQCAVCSGKLAAYAVFGKAPLLFHCDDCQTECLLPSPSSTELAAYYNDYQTTRYTPSEVRRLTALAKLGLVHSARSAGLSSDAFRGKHFFEAAFGCGSSLFASVELGAHATGVDMDPEATARVRELAASDGYAVDVHLGRVETFLGRDGEFDFVRASHVLEHTVEPRQFVRRLRELLRPGGVLMLECPNNKALVWLAKNALRLKMHREDFYNALKKTEHLWGFNQGSLALLLEQEGFRVQSVTDYSVADYRYQPDVALWYPKWSKALPDYLSKRSPEALVYAAVRSLDAWSSRLARGGMGLAAVAARF